jgi:hypothetical protein
MSEDAMILATGGDDVKEAIYLGDHLVIEQEQYAPAIESLIASAAVEPEGLGESEWSLLEAFMSEFAKEARSLPETERPSVPPPSSSRSSLSKFFKTLVPRMATDRLVAQPIPIAELHCPHLDGVRTSFVKTESAKDSAGFRVALVGKPGLTGAVTISLRNEMETRGECGRIFAHGTIVTVTWTFGRSEISFRRVEDLSSVFSFEPWAPSAEHCVAGTFSTVVQRIRRELEAGQRTNAELRPVCLGSSSQKSKGSSKVEKERRFKFSISGLEIETALMNGVEMGFEITPQGAYLGYHPDPTTAAVIWVWAEGADCGDGVLEAV